MAKKDYDKTLPDAASPSSGSGLHVFYGKLGLGHSTKSFLIQQETLSI